MLEVRASGGVEAQDDKQSFYEECTLLEEIYASTPFPSRIVMEEITAELHLSIHKVRCWFNNRRAKTARDSLAKTMKKPHEKHSLKRPPMNQQKDLLNLHIAKARPASTSKLSENCFADRRLSLPAQLCHESAISAEVLKPQRYRIHDDLGSLELEQDGLDPLLQTISHDANTLLMRVDDRPGSNFGTSHCLTLLKALVVKAEKFVDRGSARGICTLVTLARSFAYRVAHLNNAFDERTQFSTFLSHCVLNAVLRTDLAKFNIDRRSYLQQIIIFFCKRVSQYDAIPILQVLPMLFLNPWPSWFLDGITKGRCDGKDFNNCSRELFDVAQCRIDILLESSRFAEAVSLARWYCEGGGIFNARSGSDFLATYVSTLLRARRFDDAVSVLIQHRDRWQGETIVEWVQQFVDAGSLRQAELILQTLSPSCTRFKH